jgi:hypothetical protein
MRLAGLALVALGAGCARPPQAPPRVAAWLFLSTECPASNRAHGEIDRVARAFPQVEFRAVYPNLHETDPEVAGHAAQAGFPFPAVRDPDGRWTGRFKVAVTPTACLLDFRDELRYRGRLEDLGEAIEAVLAGNPVARPETEAAGCRVKRARPAAAGEVTYARDAAPILNRRCLSCHRPGQIGPVSLEGYERASAWAPEIKRYVKSRRMPPWKPVSRDVAYAHDRRLPEVEIETLSRWADAGAPLGDPKDLPAPPVFPQGWALGEPDLVLEPPEAFDVAASGEDEYRGFVLPTGLQEDRYVTAVEFHPGNPRVVHHIMTYIDVSGVCRKRDAQDPVPGFNSKGTGPGFFPAGDLGGWGPGTQPRGLPPGYGWLLPKGADIVMEVHYHKTGRPERDRTRIGLHLAKVPPARRVRSAIALNMTFAIPPGAERHRVTSQWTAPQDVQALAVIPHMHLLGREIDVTARFPDGSARTLVKIDDWDFTWQEAYYFREPLALPRGTRVTVTSWFDNRAENPRNPNRPPREVRFGINTTDEMSVAYLAYARDREEGEK